MTTLELIEALYALCNQGVTDGRNVFAMEVKTEGCDCYGDVAELVIEDCREGDAVVLKRPHQYK